MILNLEDIKTITYGVEEVKEENGLFEFYRFTEAELKNNKAENFFRPAGVFLEFVTDAKELALKGNIEKILEGRSYYSVDVLQNNELIHSVKNYNKEELNSEYANYKYVTSDFDEVVRLAEGSKTIRIVLPFSVICKIEKLELIGANYFKSVKKEKLIVAYGDSITQGYDALNPKDTYVMRMAQYFSANVINKGIGGMQFNPELASCAYDSKPDFITVAFGTNDWNWNGLEFIRKQCTAFLEEIVKIYGNAPVFIISPIWRHDCESKEKAAGDFLNVEKMIFEVAENYPSVTAISGWELVPHSPEYFGDGGLHPAANGFECYFENLKKFLPKK